MDANVQDGTVGWKLPGVNKAVEVRHPMTQSEMLPLQLSGQETPCWCQGLCFRESGDSADSTRTGMCWQGWMEPG